MLPLASPARLRLALQRLPEDIFEPGFVADAPLVRFLAYTGDGRISGWVRLHADRLTDLLNGCDELQLTDVEIERFVDGVTGGADEIIVRRRELVAVHARGPRGDETRRRQTRTHPMAMQSGSFLIGGHLHVPPGVDPVANLRERPPMIPLTDAWIEYWSGGERRRQWTGTLVVNRDEADWMRPVTPEELTEGLLRPAKPIARVTVP